MTTQPKTIDSPLLGATFVAVNRNVLVEILDRAWLWSEGDYPEEEVARVFQLRNEVEAGRIDVLDATTFNGTPDPA